MPEKIQSFYWDTTCWLCLINEEERNRRKICVDILKHAKDGKIQLYTSTFSITEVIRPKYKIKGRKVPKLSLDQLSQITNFFKHRYIKKISLDETIAIRAVELARKFSLSPADSVHGASALEKSVDILQAWDRDFGRLSSLIKIEMPQKLTPQTDIEDFLHD